MASSSIDPSSSSNTDSDNEIASDSNSTTNPKKSIVSVANPSSAGVCLAQFAFDAAGGSFIGSIFGFATGLVQRKGFSGSLSQAGATAKSFAVLSGVHSLVICFMQRIRGKTDVFSAGVAGCCTGIAISFPGAPQALLQNCVTLGLFSCIVERFNRQQPALAQSTSCRNRNKTQQQQLLKSPAFLAPPLSLPLPLELKGSFSSFCNTVIKSNKNRIPTAW